MGGCVSVSGELCRLYRGVGGGEDGSIVSGRGERIEVLRILVFSSTGLRNGEERRRVAG